MLCSNIYKSFEDYEKTIRSIDSPWVRANLSVMFFSYEVIINYT